MTGGEGPASFPGSYVIHRRAGVCWITSEPDQADIPWRPGEPIAAVVVMIARAVDLDGADITAQVAVAVRDALAAMAARPGTAPGAGMAGDHP